MSMLCPSINFWNLTSIFDILISFDRLTVTIQDTASTMIDRISVVDVFYDREWHHSIKTS